MQQPKGERAHSLQQPQQEQRGQQQQEDWARGGLGAARSLEVEPPAADMATSTALLLADGGLRGKTYSSACTAELERRWGWRASTAFFAAAPPLLGVVLGLLLPGSGHLPLPWQRISSVIGWTYFSAWSISFYPQAWLNHQRKSVSGLSMDFQVLNMLGFTCLSIYYAALYLSPTVRAQYAAEFGGQPAVHSNDVFFALHAAALTAFTLWQCFVLYPSTCGPVHAAVLAACAGVAIGAAAFAGAILAFAPAHCDAAGGACISRWLSWLGLCYALSYAKLAVSLTKYFPQLVLNHRRRSTVGWALPNVLLDLEGGTLSLAQQLMDSAVLKDWSAITGNPVKFGLGLCSFAFDFAFIFQHYVLFPDRVDSDARQQQQQADEEGPPAVPAAQGSSEVTALLGT